MGFVNDKCSGVGRGYRREGRERGDIAIHAEEGFRYEESPAPGPAEVIKVPFGCWSVEVRIEGEFGMGESTGIDDARMNGTVGDDEILRPGQGRDDAKVGLIARWKEKGGRQADQVSKVILKSDVHGEVASDESGGASAEASGGRGLYGSAYEPGICGKSEVVVGTEGYELLPIQSYIDP